MHIEKISTPNIPSRDSNSYELDVYCWKKLCSEHNPSTILELGTGGGLFLSSVMPLLPESRAVTINAPLQEKTKGRYTTFDTPSEDKIGKLFKQKEYEKRIEQVFCLTKDMTEVLGSQKFDLIHIDASHDKNDVILDSFNSLKALNAGGTIVWHDFHPNKPAAWIKEVYTAIEEFCTEQLIESVNWFDRSWVCYKNF